MPRLAASLLAFCLLTGCRTSGGGTESPPAGGAAPVADVADGTTAPVSAFRYPQARRDVHVDDYHGVTVPDPYRWLEDMEGPDTRAWIDAENRLTLGHLDSIAARKPLRDRLAELWDFERWGVPTREGDRLVVGRNDGLQNHSVIHTIAEDGATSVLLDPNAMSADGTVALAGQAFSKDGRLMAYGTAAAGSDWQIWKIRDVASAHDRDDELRWIKFASPSWSADGKGLFYARYDEPKAGAELSAENYDQKVYYHRLGTPQAADVLVYARPDQKQWGFEPEVTDDGRWLVITVKIGTDPRTSIFVQDLRSKARKTIEVLPGFSARFRFVGNKGSTLWLTTDDNATRGRLIAVDVRKPERGNWRTIIPESMRTLVDVSAVGDRFVANWLDNAQSKVSIHTLDGKLERELELPGIGTISGFAGKLSDRQTYFSFTGFATPTEVWKLDVASGKTELWRRPTVKFKSSDYVTEQVFFPSTDTTQIPMFITHKKGMKWDGKNPTYLFGYGGFNVSLTPSFSVANLVWMEMGGVLAVPNLRGGGEFGETWHKAGTKLDKQNVFDDFIAAAEFLIAKGYTSKERLAIGGRSNGGLLVGAVLTQRPDLFGAALPGVGVLDMLRFNKFTIGWAWESDYGSPQKPDEFAALMAYSPYHNVKGNTQYPPTLVYTADHDDRVVPAHSYKFIAALQHAQRGDDPVLIRIDTKSGHGAGKPTTKQIEEWADLWGFLVAHLGIDPAKIGGS